MASKTTASKPSARGNKVLVGAIDFGTTYSGYAWSLKCEHDQIMTSNWKAIAGPQARVPTVVLLKPDKTFHSFGYEAQEKYQNLLDTEDSTVKDWHYFDRFKMKLYKTKKLKRDTELEDASGHKLPAVDVFSIVIGHLKEMLEKELELRFAGFQREEIHWVVTVPAIWSDSAKQFMKEAAIKAGIDKTRIQLVLEPEAAALYGISKKSCRVAKTDGSFEFESLPEGHKYIVADLGGGTADLAVHEILSDRNLKEIRRSDGNDSGGHLVNKAFENFLRNVFGGATIDLLHERYQSEIIEINSQFDMKKRMFQKDMKERISIKLNRHVLSEIFSETDGCTYADKIKAASQQHENLKFVADKMLIPADIMETFFKPAVDGILGFIKKMREEDELNETNTLLMVGGFSESEYVTQLVRENNPGMKIIVPPEPSLAVLKGAVLMGHHPKTITQRVARFTYGFDCARAFEEGKDPENLKQEQDGEILCTSVFKKMIEMGQVLKAGDTFGIPLTHSCTQQSKKYSVLASALYKSEEKDPKYSEEEYGCEVAGILIHFPPEEGWPKLTLMLNLLVVGETEMTLISFNTSNNMIMGGKLDFL